MVVRDDTFNKHFFNMVTEGVACGLNHPVEWLMSYSRGIGAPYGELPVIDEFIRLAANELYKCTFPGQSDPTPDDIHRWMNEYYRKTSNKEE